MQLLGNLDMLHFVRTVGLNWTGHVDRMVSTRKVIRISNDEPQERRLRGRPKTDGGTVYRRILIGAKLKNGKRSEKKKRVDGEKAITEAKVRIGLGD